MKQSVFAIALFVAGAAAAQSSGRDAFQGQQAMGEVRRVAGQVDCLQNNVDDLAARVGKLERRSNASEIESLRSEIAALKAAVGELKRDQARQREEIVAELSGKVAKIVRTQAPAPAPRPVTRTVTVGPHQEYVVKSGDTLSLIAEAFGTSVAKIKEMNGLKKDSLRVGQKLNVPQN